MRCSLRLARRQQHNPARFPGRNERNFSDYVKERNKSAPCECGYNLVGFMPLWREPDTMACCVKHFFDSHLLYKIKSRSLQPAMARLYGGKGNEWGEGLQVKTKKILIHNPLSFIKIAMCNRVWGVSEGGLIPYRYMAVYCVDRFDTSCNKYTFVSLGYVQNHLKFRAKIFAKKPLFAILVAQKRDKEHGETSILGLRLKLGE